MGNLLYSPHNSLKGKTIKSFKSMGDMSGYILVCTDGSEFEVKGFSYPAKVGVSKIK
jgi:hypothetical protein